MKLRNAAASDAPALYELHSDAFSTFQVFGPPWWSDVPFLQASLTCRQDYAPELSRILEDDAGEILGHAFWNRYTLLLEGMKIKTAVLAPLGVRSDRQKGGLGRLLMEDGLGLLKKQEFELLLVLGHPEYYPRFGLKTRCYGQSAAEVPRKALQAPSAGSLLRPLRPQDLPFLEDLWQKVCSRDPGTLLPDKGFIAWGSHVKDVAAGVLEKNGQVLGYFRADLRPDADPQTAVKSFLAGGPDPASDLMALLADWIPAWKKGVAEYYSLPLGPSSGPLLFPGARITAEPWDGGMAMALPGPAQFKIDALLEGIRSGSHPPLSIQWGPLFDE